MTRRTPSKTQNLQYLHQAISLARQSPPKPTNFRVGAVLVSYDSTTSSSSTNTAPTVLATGYTLELPGNTHAEQNCLTKLCNAQNLPTDSLTSLSTALSARQNVYLYTTLEPCALRLSGNISCVARIIATRSPSSSAPTSSISLTTTSGSGIQKVIFGAKEPGTFVQDSQSCRLLTEAGVEWEYIPDLESEILAVAMEGHHQEKTAVDQKAEEAKGFAKAGQNEKSSEPQRQQVEEEEEEQNKGTNVDDISPEERRRQEEMPRNPKKRMMEI